MTDSLQCCDLHWLSGKHKPAQLPQNQVRKSECLQGDGKAEAEQPLRGEHGYRGPPSTSPHPHLALQELSQLSVGFCCTPSWSQHRSHPHTAHKRGSVLLQTDPRVSPTAQHRECWLWAHTHTEVQRNTIPAPYPMGRNVCLPTDCRQSEELHSFQVPNA